MAELELSKHVAPTQQGQPLPVYNRSQNAEVTPFPNLQSSLAAYGSATNWMSTIGSYVASRASNEIATRLGTRAGKNPQGDLGIPLTEFDEAMQKSYQTQSQVTLGLQAHKLITDTNLEMSKATRITPDLIQKANTSISIGLQNIFKNAPSEVKPHLEYQYKQIQMNQASELSDRMLKEQKEDRRNLTAFSSQVGAEQVYNLGINGNFETAQSIIDSVKKANQSDAQSRIVTLETAKTNVDTVVKSFLSGKYIYEYNKAKSENKGEVFLRSLAEKKPADIPEQDYLAITNNVLQYVNHQQALRSQDEQLHVAKMNVSITRDVMGITGAQMDEYKQNVSPKQFEQTQITYISAMKAFNKAQGDQNAVISQWSDPAGFARAGTESVNKAFDTLVTGYMAQRQRQGAPITQDEAEVQVAASAAGVVPNFVSTLSNKINSANPLMMDSAARQIDSLYNMNAHQALSKLDDKDKAIFTQYKALRDALPPDEAAKIAIQNANQDPDTQHMNKEKWAAFVKTSTGGLLSSSSPTDFALRQAGLNKKDFINPGVANEYGNLILNKYSAYYQMLNGDKDNALKMVKQHVKENYGYTHVNGSSTLTLHPLEQVLGYKDNPDVVPFIQNDVREKLNASMAFMKKAYDEKQSNEYWEVLSPETEAKSTLGFKYKSNEPVKLRKITRGQTTTTENYNVMLIGNSFNWDVVLETGSGFRPLMQVAPYLGIATYTPNKKAIDTAYIKAHGVK